ncbi:DUF3300 domain-containing protein [uncultured Paraglaciecola sp.]|uniref:DUF3300 domain-containing protein n=1 Tax=uncultured Paraglaciecola sp. TaxID=1765024 RepID=UPI00260ECDAE|nr:DUF3300 domain-containing protein [uncultured Paraglaciecola sp.]
MRNQSKYLFIYLLVLCLLLGSVLQLAQAQGAASNTQADVIELDQAQLDQMLAPIALYPDTLLSHILVASTYPLEVIQAARWRAANSDLDEQQALNAVENKDWDPSVQALVPFNELLQKLSEDLNWLQSLGSAFLANEQQLLASVQNLRQKAYEQGNLTDNEYVNIQQEANEIVIETVRKEVVYVPYYDTRVVYGNWWWHNHQPYYWHRPVHSILSAGLYWSVGFNIRPSFYFGGFHWRKRHLVANYHYRNHAKRHWPKGHSSRQVVRVKEYPRWRHNKHHRRGVQHRVNGQPIVRNIRSGNTHKSYHKNNKQRLLNADHYAKKHSKPHAKQVKHALAKQSKTIRHTKVHKANKQALHKQRIAYKSNNHQKPKHGHNNPSQKSSRIATSHKSDVRRPKQAYQEVKNRKLNTASIKPRKNSHYQVKNQSHQKRTSHNKSLKRHNKSRPTKVARHNKSKNKQR